MVAGVDGGGEVQGYGVGGEVVVGWGEGEWRFRCLSRWRGAKTAGACASVRRRLRESEVVRESLGSGVGYMLYIDVPAFPCRVESSSI